MLPDSGYEVEGEAPNFQRARRRMIENFEQRFVKELLRKHRGNVTHAAQKAGKDRRDFGRLIKKYGISKGVIYS
jgi:DNA-binding NtrC family response regulator